MNTPTPNPRPARRHEPVCPNPDAAPSQAVVQAWHNFGGEDAEYRKMLGDMAGPPHARILIEHSCGWSVSMAPEPKSWTYVADAIRRHFGRLADDDAAPAEPAVELSAVPVEGSGHPQPARHGTDGHDGYVSPRCAAGMPGCASRGCICRCHIDTPEGATDPRSRLDRMRVAPASTARIPTANCTRTPRELPPMSTEHGLTIVRDEQRKSGWYLSWRCGRKACDARGNATTPRREKALELFALLDAGHRQSEGATNEH